MPKRRDPIVDHYGTEIKVEPLMGSIGPCVDLERTWQEEDVTAPGTFVDRETFDRLTLQEAIELAEWLVEAVEAPR